MSKKTEALASTSAAAIAAATDKQVVELAITDIPSFGETPSAAEAEEWVKTTQQCAGDSLEYERKSRTAAQQALVMMVMASQLNPLSYWETKLKEAGLGLPKNKDVLTYASAYILRLDVGNADKKKASDHSKALNRYAAAGRAVIKIAREELGGRDGKVAFAYDQACVQKLVSMIIENGGINMMALMRADEFGVKDQLIKLSAEEHSLHQAGLLEKMLESGREIVVAVSSRSEGNEETVTQKLIVTPEVLDALSPQLKLADPRIRFIAELFTVGEAVAEERTALLQNPETDDPADPSSPRRLASRQYVFHPGGEMTISPILSDSSVVVCVAPRIDLLGMEIKGDVRFQTYGRRRAAVNISDPKRQDAFDFEVVDAGETEGVARIRLTTSVAKAKDDKTKDVGMLIEQVRSRAGNYPLVVAPSFSPVASLDAVPELLDKMEAVAANAKRLLKDKVPVLFLIKDGLLKVSEYKLGQKRPDDAEVMPVRPDDFLAVLKALASMKPLEGFGVKLGRGMVVISFATEFADYRIHVPATLRDMTRSNDHIATLVPVTWPQNGGDTAASTDDEAPAQNPEQDAA